MSAAGGSPTPARVRLRPALLDDLAEAFAWYEGQAEGVGHDFVRAFFAAVARAARQPRLTRPCYGNFRRVRLRRFPYSLYYRAEADETVLILLFHGARDPKALRVALRARRGAG